MSQSKFQLLRERIQKLGITSYEFNDFVNAINEKNEARLTAIEDKMKSFQSESSREMIARVLSTCNEFQKLNEEKISTTETKIQRVYDRLDAIIAESLGMSVKSQVQSSEITTLEEKIKHLEGVVALLKPKQPEIPVVKSLTRSMSLSRVKK
jgi:ribosomal protein L17